LNLLSKAPRVQRTLSQAAFIGHEVPSRYKFHQKPPAASTSERSDQSSRLLSHAGANTASGEGRHRQHGGKEAGGRCQQRPKGVNSAATMKLRAQE
jgi:hypothetical protein